MKISCKIADITPPMTHRDLFTRRRCYLGISLGNPLFRGDTLHSLLLWINDHFDECLVVVGDYLQRYNEQMFGAREGDSAGLEAIRAGDAFIAESYPIFDRLPSSKFRLTRWMSYLETTEFSKTKRVLDELFISNYEFRASIDRTSVEFINRQVRNKKVPVVDRERAIALSTRYLMEEIAVFSVLVEKGYEVEVYPGPELPVLTEIAHGHFPNVPEPLKRRVNVELRIRRR